MWARFDPRAILALTLALAPGCGLTDDDSPNGCTQPPDGNWRVDEREIPDVVGRAPAAAADAFERADVAVSWRYTYATGPDDRTGYSECWCVPPPDGTVEHVDVTEGSWAVVFVRRDTAINGGRPQPEFGWGCEADA